MLDADNVDAVARSAAGSTGSRSHRARGGPDADDDPGEIAGRLDERFRLLTGGRRTAVERHQTLRRRSTGPMTCSTPRNAELLDRLGVFAGGFTLDAAEAVVSGDGIDAFDVLDASASSSTSRSWSPNTTPTAPGTASSKRSASTRSNDSTTLAKPTRPPTPRHVVRRFVAEASVGMQGPDEAAWLERLDREIDNVRAALTWATGADDAELSLSLIGTFGLWNLWGRPLGYVLGPWAAAALATTGAVDDPRFARCWRYGHIDHFNHQRIDEAERDARRAIELMAEPGIPFSTNPWTTLCLVLM